MPIGLIGRQERFIAARPSHGCTTDPFAYDTHENPIRSTLRWRTAKRSARYRAPLCALRLAQGRGRHRRPLVYSAKAGNARKGGSRHHATVAGYGDRRALGLCLCWPVVRVGREQETPKGCPFRHPAKMTLDCIFVSTIDDWKALDNYNLHHLRANSEDPLPHRARHLLQALLAVRDRIAVVVSRPGRLCAFGATPLLGWG